MTQDHADPAALAARWAAIRQAATTLPPHPVGAGPRHLASRATRGDGTGARDPALLKLFFGGDQHLIATAQIDAHRRQMEVHEELASKVGEGHCGRFPASA